MDVEFAFLAQRAELVFEGLRVQGAAINTLFPESLPVQYPEMRLVVCFSAHRLEDGNTYNVQIRVIDADGGQLHREDTTHHYYRTEGVQHQTDGDMVLYRVPLTFTAEGDYEVVVLIDNHVRKIIPLKIMVPPVKDV